MSPAASPALSSTVTARRETAEAEYRQLMHDIFHDLSQPLSTLTCLLEVNLLVSRPAKRMRHDLQIALKQTHSVMRLIRGLRELVGAGDPQEEQSAVNLTDGLREVVADLLPVAEKQNVKLSLVAEVDGSKDQCLVRFQAWRLRQGLLRLLEFAMEGCPRGTEIKITATRGDAAARVAVAIPSLSPRGGIVRKVGTRAKREAPVSGSAKVKPPELKTRLALVIARRIFESGDGSLQVQHGTAGLCLAVCLPRIASPQ